MLLHPNTPNHPLNFHGFSYSQKFSQNSISYHKQQPLIPKTKKLNPVFVTFSSQAVIDFEKKQPTVTKWSEIHKKVSTADMDAASVLNKLESDGKMMMSKWELCRVVKELRKFRRYELALQVYDWMNSRPKRYRTTMSDSAIQLDLISKVHGIPSAEQYFQKLPNTLKDKRVYGSLLNAYARAKMQDEAESLMDKMRRKNYATHSLPFNVMMTLYMSLKDHAKVESLVSEMKEKKIPLDAYSYNIWLSSHGYQGSLEKMELVFEQMQLDSSVNPNWISFSSMANVYAKFEQFKKADDCLKKLESIATDQDRMPYHHLISLYATIGNREEIYRVWNLYKAKFKNAPNLGYHTILAALVRVNDIEGAEKMYTEWLSVQSLYDARVVNLLLGAYVRIGNSVKVATLFNQMLEWGGKPSSATWEILAEHHMNNKRFTDALSCLQNAVSAEGAKSWKPKPSNVTSFLQVFEQECDLASKDALIEVWKQAGCLDDTIGYMTSTRDVSSVDSRPVSDGEGEYVGVGEVGESL